MTHEANRRAFLGRAVGAAAALAAWRPAGAGGADPKPTQTAIPRWRGFNLTNFFQAFSSGEQGQGMVQEDDLRWIRDWGFDFIRLPMDYWLWIDSDWKQTRKLAPDDLFKIDQRALEKVDRAVDLCRKYGLHLSLNFHRAPGYCINNPEREPLVLWRAAQAQEAFVFHWELFAKRYREAPAAQLSFNLVNEAPNPRPGYMTREDYCRIMTRAVEAIRRHSPKALILIDGLSVGNDPVPEMVPTGVAQSVHAYWPAQISHYRASWVDRKGTFPEPSWPMRDARGKVTHGRPQLEERFTRWAELARQGVGVHCGECGCFNRTPYPVFLAWFEDVMQVLRGHGIGYALWNFRGSFGILDSGRKDIRYEEWHGRQLDRTLLAMLQKY